MTLETEFLLYVIQQHWLAEDQARELWNSWKARSDGAGVDQVAVELGLLSDEEVKQARDLVGMSMTAEALGQVGEYELVERIGAGRHGVVFRAQAELSTDNVAVKVLAPRLRDDLLYLEHFTKQADAARLQEIENTATTLAAGEDEGHYYLASELIAGEDLKQRVSRDGALPEKEVLRVATTVTRALVHAEERGLVHQGIGPSDIRFTPENDILIVDLGLAKEVLDPVLFQTLAGLGIEHYLSPERAQGKEGDIRGDLFSLGAVLYLAATGNAPLAGPCAGLVLAEVPEGSARTIPSPKSVKPGLSGGFCAVLARLLARMPEDRYARPGELLKDLERVAEGSRPETARLAADRTILEMLPEPEAPAAPAPVAPAAGTPKKAAKAAGEPPTEVTHVVKSTPPRRPTTQIPAAERTPRSALERNRSRGARPSHEPKSSKSWVQLLAVLVPVLIILGGLAYVLRSNRPAPRRIVTEDEPAKPEMPPAQRELHEDYQVLQQFIQTHLESPEESRAKIAEFEKKHQDNPLYSPYRGNIRTALERLKELEKTRDERAKGKLRSQEPPKNLVMNPGFEVGAEEQPDKWTLVGQAGQWESEGAAEGQRCVSVLGKPDVSSSFWTSRIGPLEAFQVYKVSFQVMAQTDFLRPGRNVSVSLGNCVRNFEPTTKWKKEEFVFQLPSRFDAPSAPGDTGQLTEGELVLRIGASGRTEKILLDDVQVIRVKPWNTKYRNIEVGPDEGIERGIYTYKLSREKVLSNYTRCLHSFDAIFQHDCWEFQAGRSLIYAHEIVNYPQKGSGMLTFTTAGHGENATLRAEISKDFADWYELAVRKEPGSEFLRVTGEIASKLYPANRIYVKFSATGPCRLTAYTYKAELDGDLPRRISGLIGKVEEYIE